MLTRSGLEAIHCDEDSERQLARFTVLAASKKLAILWASILALGTCDYLYDQWSGAFSLVFLIISLVPAAGVNSKAALHHTECVLTGVCGRASQLTTER
ncbi:hypothetical protein DBR45_01945 [Pseudomonas sp. HMWF031]|nr:hypothetical protein DBR45_01945 [Pseudomonas sp. HMWF031]